MPLGDKIRGLRHRDRRLVRDGDEYTIDELDRGEVELEEREPLRDPPPEGARGEPWGWPDDDEHRDRPRGWPGPDHSRDDPGPYDGSWDPPGGPGGGVRDGTD